MEEIDRITQINASISQEIAASTQMQVDNQSNMDETARQLKQSSTVLDKAISNFKI